MSNNLMIKSLMLATIGIAPLVSAGEAVGTVVTPGRVLVNNLTVRGNATLSEGAVVKTTSTAARLELAGGGVVSLDAGSEAVVRQGGLQLREGKGMVANEAGRIEAMGLQVNGVEPGSQLLVAVNGGKVEVAAVQGTGRVRNQQGMLLAMIHAGKPLSFEPTAGKSESMVTGRLRREGTKYLLRDELTGLDVELRGNGLGAEHGNRVAAAGEAQITGDSDRHVVLVSRLNRLEAATVAEESAGSSSASTKAGTTAAKAGMSAGTKIGLAALAFGGLATAIVVPMAMSN